MKALVIAGLLACAGARVADAKGCHEVSDVVGYHKCTIFGAMWSREAATPKLAFDLGYISHSFDALPFQLGNAPLVEGGSTPDFHVRMQGIRTRMVGTIGRALYAGAEIDGASATTLPRPIGTQPNQGIMMSAVALGGVHLFELYRVALSVELAGGGRMENFEDCVRYSGKTCIGPSSTSGRRELEARARIDIYFHPELSLGVTYGASLLDPTDRTFGISLGVHARAMDGMY